MIATITLFMPSFRGGGAERVMVNLANQLQLKGHSVEVVVAHAQGPYRQELNTEVPVVDLNCTRVFSAVIPLMKYLKRKQPVAVLSTLTHANTVCALSHKLSGSQSRLVLREANMPDLSSGLHTKIILSFAKRLYRRANALICVSEGVRDALKHRLSLPDGLVTPVIDNPTVTKKLVDLASKPLSIDEQVPDGHLMVLACGRLTPSKGFAFLLEAFAEFQKTQTATLVILGDGEQHDALLEQAKHLGCENNLRLPGFVDNPFAWMSACDVFVLSSSSEGSPNTLIQAIACGAQVISTRLVGSTDKLLEDGRLGRLVEVGDSNALLAAMHSAVERPIQPDVQRWRERFSDASVVQQYEKYLLGDSA